MVSTSGKAGPTQEKMNLNHITGTAGLIALLLFFATGASHAYMQKPEPAGKAVTGSPATSITASGKDDKAKAASRKLVDINHASKAELKSLQGIDEVLAAKIIAGRPYLSKANLVTEKIISAGLYTQLKLQIIAKQK